MISPSCSCGSRHCSNHTSNKSRLHEPTNVIGANSVLCLRAAIQLIRSVRLPNLRRFVCGGIIPRKNRGMKALPNFAVAVRIIIPIVDEAGIDIDHLCGRFGLQSFLELERLCSSRSRSRRRSFLRLIPSFKRCTDILLRHAFAP